MSKIMGIDLGTTNSLVTIIKNNKPYIIRAENNGLVPSVVGFNPENELVVGVEAANQLVVYPQNTIKSIKRKMGTREKISIGKKKYSPEEISSFILQKLKGIAEQELQEPIEKAVITVPAYFTDSQKRATFEAGELAGLEVARLLNEPTAAALSYSLNNAEDQKILVYDLGGGTFDISVVEINSGVIEVLSSLGDTHLGGDDFDLKIVNTIINSFKKEHKIDLRKNTQAFHRVIRLAQKAKETLSDKFHVVLKEAFICEDAKGNPLHLTFEFDRIQLEELIHSEIKRTVTLVEQAITDAKIKLEEISKILLVGGSSKIPLVRKSLEESFNKEMINYLDPQENVALGAGIQAGIIQGNKTIEAVLVDICPHTLGTEAVSISPNGQPMLDQYVPIIPKNTVIPTSKEEGFVTIFPGQNKITVTVYQGENPIASQNELIDSFDLEFEPQADISEIFINFEYDLNGLITINAREKLSNTSKTKVISKYQKQTPEKAAPATSQPQKNSEIFISKELMTLTQRLKQALKNKDNKRFEINIKTLIQESESCQDPKRSEEISNEIAEFLFELEE